MRIMGTFSDQTAQKRLEAELRTERNFALAVLDNAGVLVVVLDSQGRIRRFNRAAERLSGLSFAEVEGRTPWETVLPPEAADHIREEAFVTLASEPERDSSSFTNEWLASDGGRRLVQWYNTLLRGDDGSMEFMVCVGVDITEQRAAEQALRDREASLVRAVEERETLMHEVHHRVKNNLQLVSSLLYFQSQKLTDPTVLSALRDLEERIHALVLVHEQLYLSNELSHITLRTYLEPLIDHLVRSNRLQERGIEVSVGGDDCTVSVAEAVPLGMLTVELVTNAVKHAFVAGAPGHIDVRCRATPDRVVLSVRDDGRGLPDEEPPSTSFGWRLIRALCRQLDAALEVDTDDEGTRVLMILETSGAP
jgi:PAS domain S-box-containing protein